MTERIDYRHNAEERIKVAVTHPNEVQAQTVALIAQAEATLALVEEQRIANLIAYAAHRSEHLSAIPKNASGKFGEYMSLLDAEIREGLGL